MTKIELIERQRRFEWELAREEQTKAAAKLVAGKTHDLMNLVQIVMLASEQLASRCDPTGKQFVADLLRAAKDAESSLRTLMQVARPERASLAGSPVGAAITAVVEELRPAIPIDLHLALLPDTATSLDATELAHLVIGLALEAADASRIEIHVRERMIDDAPWIEILRGADVPTHDGPLPFDLRAVDLLVARAGGELSRSERRGGGSEVVVALPAISASA